MSYTSLRTGVATGDSVLPSDYNEVAGYIENGLARVLLRLLVEEGVINRSPDTPTVDESTARIMAPTASEPLVGVLNGNCFYMTSAHELSATATGGGTTYVTSGSLTQADDYWVDAWVIFTSGAHSGTAVQVTDFEQSSGKLTWSGALGSAVAAGTTFVVTFFYIEDKTNGALNYVYGRTTGRTSEDGLIKFVASTSGTAATGDILLASMTLDVGGSVVASDNSPTNHDRNLWAGAGAVHQIEFSGSLSGLLPGAYSDITISHSDLILFGPIEVTLSDANCTWSVSEDYKKGEFVLRITNNGSYTTNVTYSGTRWGRKKVSL